MQQKPWHLTAYGLKRSFTSFLSCLGVVGLVVPCAQPANAGALEQEQAFGFGTVAIYNAAPGEVSIPPRQNADISASGGVVIIDAAQARAAKWRLTGQGQQVVMIDGNITLSNETGADITMDTVRIANGEGTMTAQTITVSPTTDIYAGGTVNFQASQPAGSYSGTFTITTNQL